MWIILGWKEKSEPMPPSPSAPRLRWLAREREAVDANHLRGQFLGRTRPGGACTGREIRC